MFKEMTMIRQGYISMMYDGYTINIEEDGADFGRVGDIGYIPFETSMDYDERVEIVSARVEEPFTLGICV
jgi:hypothetical protein